MSDDYLFIGTIRRGRIARGREGGWSVYEFLFQENYNAKDKETRKILAKTTGEK